METHSLPQYTTPLIGREAEIADIGDRLQDPTCRLLTLVGPGGIGKTRLAIAAALAQADIFRDGLFFVALQPVASANNIIRTVGSAIGYEFSADSEPEWQLHQYLNGQEQLLVLDNLEHLLGAANIIANLLQATSQLKLLVTSRAPLNMQHEWLYHVGGLAYPQMELAGAAERFAAVRLFAELAGRVRRDFSLVDEQAAIVGICRLVQGMPLGIELAAKWRRRLPSAEIAHELQNSLNILQTDQQDVPDRHRSMRAVFDHSWKLLGDEEQRAFMALSVFPGGFRREAAKEVAGASLAALMSLVDKSMLKVSRNGRYEIHELQRQYAAEKLEARPEQEAAVRDQHSAYYTRFINRPVRDFLGAGNQQTLAAIDAEIDNIRAAWNWAVAKKNVANLKQALDGLYWYAWRRSWHEEGLRAFSEAVTILRSTEPTRENQIALGRALRVLAATKVWLGRLAEVEKLIQESVAILRSLDARRDLAVAVGTYGWAAQKQQEWGRAKALLEEAAQLHEETGQNELRAFVYGQLGIIASAEGDHESAEQWYEKALSLGRQIGDQRAIAEALQNLGHLARWHGQYRRARQLYGQSLPIARSAEMTPFIIFGLWSLGDLAMITGQHGMAREYFEESLRVAIADGKGPAIAQSRIHLAEILITQGEYDAAQIELQKALEIAPGAADRARFAAVLANRGRIARLSREAAAARRHHEASLALYREMQNLPGFTNNLLALARMALEQGDLDQAAGYLTDAMQGTLNSQAPPLLLQVMAVIAEFFSKQGNLVHAVHLAALVAAHPASDTESKALARVILLTPEDTQVREKPGPALFGSNLPDLGLIGAQLLKQLAPQSALLPLESLSERELEVLNLVAEGLSNREIARALTIALGTVKSHLHHILQKLDASSRTQAVARARELHLL